MDMLTVHVRVNDDATGQATPVRLRLLDADGVCRMPLGRLPHFAVGRGEDVGGQVRLHDAVFAYIDGNCEARLPAGAIRVEVHKGPEYLPLCREVVLGPGQIALRLSVERAIDWRPRGWYSGDGRATDLSPHAAQLEAAAEGLDVVNLLAYQRWPHTALVNLLAFSGTEPTLQGQPLVVVNTCNTHPFLGTVALLNCHRVVYPLRFGGPDGLEDWSVADWCDQCHRKKGLVAWPDLPRLTAENPQGEALAALLLGKIDVFEICHLSSPQQSALIDWYRLLTCGVRVPLMGASGKDSNTRLLGAVRTYAHLRPEQEFSYATWIEAVRVGRTFVSDGPLLSLTINGREPGDELLLSDDKQTARIHVESEPRTQRSGASGRLQVLHNSEVIAESDTAMLDVEAPLAASGWLAARCLDADGGVRAHTSPIYAVIAGQSPRADAETIAPLLTVLDGTLDWLHGEARCPTEHHREQLAETLRRARLAATRSGAR